MFPSAFFPEIEQTGTSPHAHSLHRRPMRWLPAASAALGFCMLAGVPLKAQTAHFGGAIVTLGSGFNSPTGVTVDANGNVFVSDNGNNAVKEIVAVNGRIPASPAINTLGSGFAFPYTVAVDGSGNVYVTDFGHSEVKEIEAVNGSIPASPTIRILGSGFGSLFGSAVDGHGDVFVTDFTRNEVKEIAAVNGVIPASPKILSLGGGFYTPAGVAVDGSGNVFVGDQNNNAVKEILAPGYLTTNTIATGFSAPEGVAIDNNGNVYVADDGGNLVKEIVAVNGVIPPSPAILTLGSGFSQPVDVAVDGSGNVYVADAGNSAVKQIQMTGANFGPFNVGTTTFSPITMSFTFDTGGTLGSTAVVTTGTAGLDFFDAGGGSCVANTAYVAGAVCTVNVRFSPLAPGFRYGAVELLSTTGTVLASGNLQGIGVGPLATFANTTNGVSVPSSKLTAGSGFSSPGGVAVDASGDIFVADTYNNAVKEILAAGGWTTVNTIGSGFNNPNGVAVDGAGNVYVADTYNDAVKEIVAKGGYTTIKSLGIGFSNPYGVAVDGNGDVFVADFGNSEVKEIVAVNGTIPVSPNILFLARNINGPDGVAVDGNGNVFFTSYDDGTVNEITTVNGSNPPVTAIYTIASQLSGPSNISVDGIGNVFVANTNDGTIDEIVAAEGFNEVKVLGTGFTFPSAVAVTENWDVVVADTGTNLVQVMDFADPPALAFASTPEGLTSSDSPQAVTVSNEGTAPLIFSLPVSGFNPSVPANFAWDQFSGCEQTTPGSPQAFQLAAGGSCTMDFDFKPEAVGALSGNAVLTDNNLNQSGSTQSIHLSGTGIAPVPSVLTSPAPGGTLTGSSSAFSWSAGVGVTQYELALGTTGAGSRNVYGGSPVTALSSPVISGIPTSGGWLYARIYSYINGAWQFNDYTYTETGTPAKAVLTTPAPNSTLTGTSATFTWTAGAGVTEYEFKLGTTGAGSTNLYNGAPVTVLTSPLISGIPAAGAKLYARLYSYIDGAWQFTDYTYTEAGSVANAVLTSLKPGSTLTGASATFTWSSGVGVTQYEFALGTTGPGSRDVYGGSPTTALSSPLISGIPASGGWLYARLYSYINGAWQFNDYTYTEAGTPAKAALSTPTPGSTLNGASATFTWTTGAGVTEYEFKLGTTGAGSTNLYNGAATTALGSPSITGIPASGEKLYARLYSYIDGSWQFTDYTYTAP